ncbi:LOW QUALITY PROTEIN: olfactomedin-like protein 2A [Lampetra planeri]
MMELPVRPSEGFTAAPVSVVPRLPEPHGGGDGDGGCDATVLSLSAPVIHARFGHAAGAWMRDPEDPSGKIYVASHRHGSSLLEFENEAALRQGRWSASHKLPYAWLGTGHALHAGSLYYRRAFTRTALRYDLRRRHVAAWHQLHDLLLPEHRGAGDDHDDDATAGPGSPDSPGGEAGAGYGGESVTFAVDSGSLWVAYVETEGLALVLLRLGVADLAPRGEPALYRTGLSAGRSRWRSSPAASSTRRRRRRLGTAPAGGGDGDEDGDGGATLLVPYAYDTHTGALAAPGLRLRSPFRGGAGAAQLSYNARDGALYAWDSGRQLTYNVTFT